LGDPFPLTFVLASGQQVRISYTVVGTLFATQTADEAYAALGTLATRATIPTDELLARTGYEVTLNQGVSADAYAQTLQNLSAGGIGVKVYDLNPPAAVAEAVGIMAILSAVLMVVAAISILNAMLLSTRERYRELSLSRAIGLTPAQTAGSVVA